MRSLIVGLCIFSISSCFAEQHNHGKQTKGCCRKNCDKKEKTVCAMPEPITPTAPVKAERNRFFFDADFIYWQAQEDNLMVGMSGIDLTGVTVSTPGHISSIDFGYAPGFKFGAGVDFLYDGWDTYMDYTWFKSGSQSGSASTPVAGQGRLIGPVTTNSAQPETLSSTGNWHLFFNNIDWELGRKFFISKKLILRPHIGIKGSWDHQRFQLTQTLRTFTNDVYEKEHFWGVGLRGGLDTQWIFARGFSIYGNLSVAELYGQYISSTQVTQSVPAVTTHWTENSVHKMTPVLELALGFRYETPFCTSYRFYISAGWEQQIWWNHNQLISVVNTEAPQLQTSVTGGNLSFQGLDLKVGFVF